MLKKLRNSYGTPNKTYSNINTLTKSVYANFKTTKQNGYSFKLQIKYSEKKIYLCVSDKNGKLIEKDIYWDFEDIRSAIERKLNYFAFVKYDSKIIDKENFFKYTSMNCYKLKGIDSFFELLEKGLIRIYICLSIYRSDPKAGKAHDHGIVFEIKECNLLKLYDEYEFKNE